MPDSMDISIGLVVLAAEQQRALVGLRDEPARPTEVEEPALPVESQLGAGAPVHLQPLASDVSFLRHALVLHEQPVLFSPAARSPIGPFRLPREHDA